jgi:superoxide dismutase
MGSVQKEESQSYESELAKTQAAILKAREQVFQNYFLPEYKTFYDSLAPDSEAGKAQMGLTAQEINNSFDAAQKQTVQNLAQRNITQAGAGLALLAANNRARSSALANAYANQQVENNKNKLSALGVLAGTMNQTTTAAPMAQETSGWSASIG